MWASLCQACVKLKYVIEEVSASKRSLALSTRKLDVCKAIFFPPPKESAVLLQRLLTFQYMLRKCTCSAAIYCYC